MTTLMDRFVHWTLDFDGDLYGRDERERLRWYEGMATASQAHMILIPWAAAGLVWALGEPAVVPLAVVLGALLFPLACCAAWVQSRRVDPTPREWSTKRLLLGALSGLPYLVFAVGALYHLRPESNAWRSAIIGAAVGLVVGGVIQGVKTRKRRRLDAVLVADED